MTELHSEAWPRDGMVETVIGGEHYTQTYGLRAPSLVDGCKHVPVLFVGSGFEPAAAEQVDSWRVRQLVTLEIPPQNTSESVRDTLLKETLGALALGNAAYTYRCVVVALQPRDVREVVGRARGDGAFASFDQFIVPTRYKNSWNVRRSTSTFRFAPGIVSHAEPDAILEQYKAVGELLDEFDQRIFNGSL